MAYKRGFSHNLLDGSLLATPTQVWGPGWVAGGVATHLRACVHAGRCSPPALAAYEVPFVLPEALEGFTIV
jgi:hypothetical protein